MSADVNKRGCYCDLWDKNPASLIEQGVPRGFCGICIRCGKPGHLRQAPGATPVTLAWCDACYRRQEALHWLRVVVFVAGFAGLLVLAVKWLMP